jgi:signal peptidase II
MTTDQEGNLTQDDRSKNPSGASRLPQVEVNRYVVFLLLAVVGSVADLWTKSWIFAELGMPGGRIWWLFDGVFGFQTSLNEGALFGIGQGQVFWFALMSLFALLGLTVWLFYFRAAASWLLTVAFGLVTAGILGNLYDRMGMPGLIWNYPNSLHEIGTPVYAVRDWILVMFGSWPWPTFNLADSYLVCGAILLAWHAWRMPEPKKSKAGG